jgi:hypothetical protein
LHGFLLRPDHSNKSWSYPHPRFNGKDLMLWNIANAVSNMFC